MKKIIQIILLTVVVNSTFAQTGNVGIGTATPDASAVLDINSSNKGVLFPNVALTSASAATPLSSPATGLIVWNTGTGGLSPAGYYYNSGTSVSPVWTKVANGAVLTNTLTNGRILIGNASNIATEQTMSGDVAISNTGVATVQDNSVDGTDIALGSDATGDLMYYDGTNWVRLASGTTGQLLQANGAAAPSWSARTAILNSQNGLSTVTTGGSASATTPYVELGGTLYKATTITQASNAFTIANNGTANTIVNLSSSGDLDIQDNGTSALFVRDDGNVGINNNAPTAKLHVIVPANTANNNPAANGIYVYNAGDNAGDNDDAIIGARVLGANSGDPFFSLDIDGITGWSIGIDNNDLDKLKFSNAWNDPGANTRMTITTAGDVGIGTTAPTAKLDVAGILAMNDNGIRLRQGTDANHQVIFNATVDGPSIEGCGGIQFKKNCTPEVLGVWNTTALDVQNSQIYAREDRKSVV